MSLRNGELMKKFSDITIKANAVEFINDFQEKALLIYSPTSIKNKKISNDNLIMISTHQVSKKINDIDKVIDENKECKVIISFGGGTASDIAKYISYKSNKMVICIPTMLSTNVYSTNKVALILDNEKITLDAKLPDEIILDLELLKESKLQNLYGVADILSIHTALYDWKLSAKENNETIDEYIYQLANDLLLDVISLTLENDFEKIKERIEKTYYCVGQAGHITNLFGSGKPESGSEHIFAKCLESKLEIHHGLSVTIGIILMSKLQNNYSEEIIECLRKLNLINSVREANIPPELIREVLEEIKPREDRYSIINTFKKDDFNIDGLLRVYEGVLNESVNSK